LLFSWLKARVWLLVWYGGSSQLLW